MARNKTVSASSSTPKEQQQQQQQQQQQHTISKLVSPRFRDLSPVNRACKVKNTPSVSPSGKVSHFPTAISVRKTPMGSARRMRVSNSAFTPSSQARAKLFGETVKEMLIRSARKQKQEKSIVADEQDMMLQVNKLNFGEETKDLSISKSNSIAKEKNSPPPDERSRFGFRQRQSQTVTSIKSDAELSTSESANIEKESDVREEIDEALLDINEEILVFEKEKLERDISFLLHD